MSSERDTFLPHAAQVWRKGCEEHLPAFLSLGSMLPLQCREPSLRPEAWGWGLLPADRSCGGFSCQVLRCIGGVCMTSSEFGQKWSVLHREIGLEWHCCSRTRALFKSSKSVQHGRKLARKTLCRVSVSTCQLDSSSPLLQPGITHTCIAPVFRDLQGRRLPTLPILSISTIS